MELLFIGMEMKVGFTGITAIKKHLKHGKKGV